MLELIKSTFGEYFNSVEIAHVVDESKVVYDIRLDFKDMQVSIVGFGIKVGRQKEFRYPKFEDSNYRGLNKIDRKRYEKAYFKENIPPIVARLALNEYMNNIKVEEW